MFILFQSSPKYPVVKPVDLRCVQLYYTKFEEALRNLEEIQKDKAVSAQ